MRSDRDRRPNASDHTETKRARDARLKPSAQHSMNHESQLEEADTYPYVNTYIDIEEAERIFDAIKSYKVDIVEVGAYAINHLAVDTKFMGKYLVIDAKRDSEYRSLNVIVDWFSEYARCRSRRFDQAYSPYEYWMKYRPVLEIKCKSRIGTLTNEELNTMIYEKTRQCVCMRPTVIKTFYRLFGPARVLDPFCGFGSSLIAAMACDIGFVGCDPNENLIVPYRNMIELLKPEHVECTVIHEPFEDATIDGRFDMVFTSPPFYDVEVYSEDDTQSVVRYKTEALWYGQFLVPCIDKAWDLLTKDGVMIIYMTNVYDSDSKRIKYGLTERLIKYVSSLVDASYMGCISFADIIYPKRPEGTHKLDRVQPLFVWRKT